MTDPITKDEAAALESVIRRVARRYIRRVWWVDEDDLVAEGWVSALNARADYLSRPAELRRVPTWAWCWRVLILELHQYVLRMGSPVSGRKKRAECLVGTRRDSKALGALLGNPGIHGDGGPRGKERTNARADPDPGYKPVDDDDLHKLVAERVIAEKVRECLTRMAGPDAQVLVPVALKLTTVISMADKHGIPRRGLGHKVWRFHRKICESGELKDLAEELDQ